ncbi:MAG: hypothetical protein AAF689_15210 [Pseudomonadota bacterium]
MMFTAHHTSAFWHDEAGAVTVDWVVLTSALVGLALAVILVVSNGVESLSEDTTNELGGVSIITSFARAATQFSGDFSDGMAGWFGGTAVSLAGFGDVLQLGPGETSELSVNIPSGATSATVSFDLIAGDDLDGDPASIMINGQVVSVYRDDHGHVTVDADAPSGISVQVDHQAINDPIGAGSHGSDSISTYTITVDNPGSNLTFGVNSGADEPTSSEFYALDNVSVVSE